jgi:hypothetical protein
MNPGAKGMGNINFSERALKVKRALHGAYGRVKHVCSDVERVA